MSQRYPGGGGSSGSRRPAPAYQTSSSSRNYSSTGTSDRDYSRSHLSSNGGSSANYYSSSSSRKPESGTTGYSYLEPNWIEKTRSTLPVDPYSSSYLDRAPLSTSRDYTSAASQPVYPSAAAAALSVGGSYGASSTMPKAYGMVAARADDYYRAPTSALAPTTAYGYPSAFEQSTMAAQAAAIYEMANHNSKRDSWPTSTHVVDYGRREDDRRGGERRREEGRKDERRGAAESWRAREREVPRDRDRRPPLPTRERDREADLRVTVSSSSRHNNHREVKRNDRPTAAPLVRGGRHEQIRDRDVRDTRDVSRRTDDKRAAVDSSSRKYVEPAQLDRESRDLERQLARVQRELEQLESGGRSKGSSREKESDRSRRSAPSASLSTRRPPSPPRARAKPPPPRRAPPPSRSTLALSSSAYHRTPAVRPSRYGGRARPAALPSLLDTVIPRPGRRPVPVTTRASRLIRELPVRRGAAPPRLPVTKRIAGYAAKRTTRGRGETVSSREKVRRAKDKMRREDERMRRMEKRKEGRDERSKESREKRKEEDFAWLESIMSEDEELDEETNRKVLLAPRRRRVMAIVDRDAVHPHTLENLDAKREADAVADEGEEPVLWTAEECEAIELLPIIDSMEAVACEVGAAFLAAHPDPVPQKMPDSNGNEKMEE